MDTKKLLNSFTRKNYLNAFKIAGEEKMVFQHGENNQRSSFWGRWIGNCWAYRINNYEDFLRLCEQYKIKIKDREKLVNDIVTSDYGVTIMLEEEVEA
jgi:predicted hydrocarbon binding protein